MTSETRVNLLVKIARLENETKTGDFGYNKFTPFQNICIRIALLFLEILICRER